MLPWTHVQAVSTHVDVSVWKTVHWLWTSTGYPDGLLTEHYMWITVQVYSFTICVHRLHTHWMSCVNTSFFDSILRRSWGFFYMYQKGGIKYSKSFRINEIVFQRHIKQLLPWNLIHQHRMLQFNFPRLPSFYIFILFPSSISLQNCLFVFYLAMLSSWYQGRQNPEQYKRLSL